MFFEPEVFIVESLELKDEKVDRTEGRFLSHLLTLGEKKPRYYYLRSKYELQKILEEFDRSRYRYLHLSCHGTDSGIMTAFDEIPFREAGKLLRPHLREKRLFISACSAVKKPLARELFRIPGCLSLIGPKTDVYFDEVAVVWASFYYLMFKVDNEKMVRRNIEPTLRNLQNIFAVPLLYYSKSANKQGFERISLD